MSKNLILYGEVGWDFTSKEVVSWLMENKDESVNIHVNSPGGLVYEAIAIREAIRGVKDCTIFIDSIAASAAAIISLCGKPVKMGKFAQIMLHSASTYAEGNKAEMAKQMEELDKVDRQLAEMIADKLNKSADEVYNTYFDGNDHWLTADECVEMGIAELIEYEDKAKRAAVVIDCLNGKPKENNNNKKNTMDFKNFQSVGAFKDCADDAQVIEKAKALSDGIDAATKKIADLEKTAEKYNELLAKLKKDQDEADAKLIASAIADGRIAEANKGVYENLMKADRESATAVINSLAKPATAPKKDGKKVEEYLNEGNGTKVVMDSWEEALKKINGK